MSNPTSTQELPKLMFSQVSGKYYLVTKLYKNGSAREKFDITHAVSRAVLQGQIDELKATKPVLTDRDVAYSRVDRLEDDRGDVVWVEDIGEYFDSRIAELSKQLEGEGNV